MYTGGLENWPGLIAKIDRPLWGNPLDVLRAVRDPQAWTQCLREARLPYPAVSDKPRIDGRWLLKPKRSAGGCGIVPYTAQPFDPRTHYLQEWLDGESVSASFVTLNGNAVAPMHTVQLVGTPWCNARRFQYAGSIAVPSSGSVGTDWYWGALGRSFVETFHLRGLFGVDAILRHDIPRPVEINPRYTASVELFERQLGSALLKWHANAFEPEIELPDIIGDLRIWGKAILYARKTFTFPADGPWLDALADGVDLDETEYADIPHAGEVIEQGWPVLTIFAAAETEEECERKLQEKAQALDRRLWG
jgi:predicted ATP-grasp superfamily ATP-dependent carboligase